MRFSANPLSLSVPDPAFDSWLRDTGYLEIIEQRLSSSTTAPSSSSAPELATTGFFALLGTLLSLFTFNPFSKFTFDDFSGDTPSWTLHFFASLDSYSFPSSPTQARLRVHENVKRYARNYTSLFLLFLACSLYQMPLALVGLILCLALWDAFKLCGERWGLDRHPIFQQTLICLAQCATAVILLCTNVQMALISAIAVSYAVMILHASFRKLTPSKQSASSRTVLRS